MLTKKWKADGDVSGSWHRVSAKATNPRGVRERSGPARALGGLPVEPLHSESVTLTKKGARAKDEGFVRHAASPPIEDLVLTLQLPSVTVSHISISSGFLACVRPSLLGG